MVQIVGVCFNALKPVKIIFDAPMFYSLIYGMAIKKKNFVDCNSVI